MKRLYTLISIVALALSAMGQDYPVILKEGRTWIVRRTYLTNESPFVFKTEVDTFFVVRQWEKFGRLWSEIGCKGNAGYDVTDFYEEDGALYSKLNNNATAVIKLLDFKLKKGDRYNSRGNTCPSWMLDVVSDDETITIGGKPYRKLTVGNKYYDHGDVWVEGIGSLSHHYMTADLYNGGARLMSAKTLFVYDGDQMVFSYEDFRAKHDDVHMHVVAGDASVESQLASVAPGTLTHLEISGTPAPEDYRYIADHLLKQLRVLDLRRSSVSIIPDSAFVQGNGRTGNYNSVTVYLPPHKIHLGNQCLANEDATMEPVVTGHFPSVGGLLNRMGRNHFTIADENPHCVYTRYYGAYSSSLDTLFWADDAPDYNSTVPEGVKVIAAHAYESQCVSQHLSIPSSMEYIGDMAFFNTEANIPVGGGGHLLLLTCHAVVPPVLGKEVFLCGLGDRRFQHDWVLCVPKESVEAYRQADGWKDFPVITWIGDDVDIYAGVESATTGKPHKRAVSDLHGRRMSTAPERGVYIEDGKVRVVR